MIAPQTIQDWIRLEDNWWWYDTADLAKLHQAIHRQYGDSPEEAILSVEQSLSLKLRSMGLEHRYEDELSKQAGTWVKNQRPVTIDEVMAYMDNLMLDSAAIELIQDVDGGPIYINVQSPMLASSQKRIIKAINRYLPPGAKIKVLSKGADGNFAQVRTAFGLELGRVLYAEPRLTTWDVVTAHLRAAAEAASLVFKDNERLAIPFTIIKEETDEEERIVTGAVLQPEVVDLTTKNPDGSDTGAVGDIYSEKEIRDAMHYWMENAGRTFAYYHAMKGGQLLNEDDVKLLENWQLRGDQVIGKQTFKKGTWMKSARILHDGLWDDIKEKRINSWSVGMHALGEIQEIEVEVEDSEAA